MTSLTHARTDSQLLDANRHFYDALWSDARLIEPERFNTWPLVRSLLAPAQRRLEVAPGVRPRLPIEDTQFVDISAAALQKLRARGGSGTLGSITALPYGNAGFDLICAFDVIEHVDDDERALAELSRVAGGGAGAAHRGAAASRAVVGVRRFRRPPAPLRACRTVGQARTTRLRGRAQ